MNYPRWSTCSGATCTHEAGDAAQWISSLQLQHHQLPGGVAAALNLQLLIPSLESLGCADLPKPPSISSPTGYRASYRPHELANHPRPP
ncbi:hypothetical protein BS78_05G042200 [Paspalum vaginatum]|nr:hypothetical protein BS78_05G042200 [Paspalum vaginatum]